MATMSMKADWPAMETVFEEMFDQRVTQYSKNYDTIYNLCCAGEGTAVFNKIREFFKRKADECKKNIEKSQDKLETYKQLWARFNLCATAIDKCSSYLNSLLQRVAALSGNVPVLAQAHIAWRDACLLPYKASLLESFLGAVNRHRSGEVVDLALLRNFVDSCVMIGQIPDTPPRTQTPGVPNMQFQQQQQPTAPVAPQFYKDTIEAPYKEGMIAFFARESDGFMQQNGPTAYMTYAIGAIDREIKRHESLIFIDGQSKMKQELDSVIVTRHLPRLLENFEDYALKHAFSELGSMFRLALRVDGGAAKMAESYYQFILTHGGQARQQCAMMLAQAKPSKTEKPAPDLFDVLDVEACTTYIKELLRLYEEFSEFLKMSFSNNGSFVASFDKAISELVNKNSNTPELLAKFSDVLLRKDNVKNAIPEEDLEKNISIMLLLFKYVHDKDRFQKHYSRALSRRLLGEVSRSMDSESSIISQLRTACGVAYVSKIVRMFQDMEVSRTVEDQFFRYCAHQNVSGITEKSFSVRVLTSNSWPVSAAAVSFIVPKQLETCLETFKKFYTKDYNGRKITWLHAQTKGEIAPLYLPKKYMWAATGFQMAILLLFSDPSVQQLSVADIKRETDINELTLAQTLKSLADPKVPVLKVVAGKGFDDPATVIAVNPDFSFAKVKFKLPAPEVRETKEENAAVNKQIAEERGFVIQAAIVRVMKSVRTIKHKELEIKAVEQIKGRFIPTPRDIKDNIEKLIVAEYMKRSDADMTVYEYLA